MNVNRLNDSLIVSISMSGPESGVMVVGRKKKNQPATVVHAFQGEEARKMYDILIGKEKV